MGIDRRRLLGSGASGVLPAPVRRRRALALDLAEAALDSVAPRRCTERALERVDARGEFTVFAFGKASVPMARAAAGAVRVVEGALLSLEPAEVLGFRRFPAQHPNPSPDAVRTGRAVRALADRLTASDRALCLVSGGGSSMLELPAAGVELAALSRLTEILRDRGAAIGELNAVRRACSQLKGGGLAAHCAPASVLNVVLSDVPGHPLSTVASGPSCPPPKDAPSAESVLRRYGLRFSLPELAARSLPHVTTVLAADGSAARRAVIRRAAKRRATEPALQDRPGFFSGDAADLGRSLAREAGPSAWVWGGETTVRVRGDGRGGRNQELLLAALAEGWTGGLLLALATDGVDGRSPAAGALLDSAVVSDARLLGLSPSTALEENDSFGFFDAVGSALHTGPTGTNVADLLIYLP